MDFPSGSASSDQEAPATVNQPVPQTARQPQITRRNVARAWSALRPSLEVPEPRFGHTAVVWQDAMVLFGGRASQRFFSDLWSYSFETECWKRVEASGRCVEARAGHTATVVRSKYMCVIAGCTTVSNCVNDVALLDLEGWCWLDAPFLEREARDSLVLPARKGHVAVNFDDTYVVVFGGSCGHPSQDDNCVWRYNVLTGSWSLLPTCGTAPSARMYHVAEKTERASVLIFGGKASRSREFCSDLYELTIETRNGSPLGVWREIDVVGSLRPSGRMCSSSVYRDGVLCVFLGGSRNYCSDSFEFDTVLRRWRKHDESPEIPGCTRPTTVLHGNTITMFGGCTADDTCLNTLFATTLESPTLKELCREWITHADDSGQETIPSQLYLYLHQPE